MWFSHRLDMVVPGPIFHLSRGQIWLKYEADSRNIASLYFEDD